MQYAQRWIKKSATRSEGSRDKRETTPTLYIGGVGQKSFTYIPLMHGHSCGEIDLLVGQGGSQMAGSRW
jgi:hypothetical protein